MVNCGFTNVELGKMEASHINILSILYKLPSMLTTLISGSPPILAVDIG